jgi:hypothetical protein
MPDIVISDGFPGLDCHALKSTEESETSTKQSRCQTLAVKSADRLSDLKVVPPIEIVVDFLLSGRWPVHRGD